MLVGFPTLSTSYRVSVTGKPEFSPNFQSPFEQHNTPSWQAVQGTFFAIECVTDVNRWDEKTGLRRDAIRSQVIDALEAQEIKETGNEEA